ncbi:sigma-70 family RNA polymerase sigma factor [Kribbella sp. NPDC006257]|uniref:sigma-70 family RNA polymerase sigma factor n=1 Tax=Kribbella sp. NPDC006257 TaxID=3156738 RepID=UPI0033A523F3
MTEQEWLEEFEQHRPRLHAVAHRMLGSVDDADDALQDAWLRIRDQAPESVENMRAWLTTVVGRVCLNMLRARRSRREVFSETHVPDPIVTVADTVGPEEEVLLAEAVGPALLIALDALTPAERFAFVLHDVFGVRFAEIAAALDRSEAAVQQLASRGRRRMRGAQTAERDLVRQRQVVDAFFAASRDGNFEALLEVLDPDVELRIDGGVLRADASLVLRGADAVTRHTTTYARLFPFLEPALVNGAAGALVVTQGRLFSVMGFTISDGRISAIEALVDPERLARLDLDRRR